jgi:hypothetical protein
MNPGYRLHFLNGGWGQGLLSGLNLPKYFWQITRGLHGSLHGMLQESESKINQHLNGIGSSPIYLYKKTKRQKNLTHSVDPTHFNGLISRFFTTRLRVRPTLAFDSHIRPDQSSGLICGSILLSLGTFYNHFQHFHAAGRIGSVLFSFREPWPIGI